MKIGGLQSRAGNILAAGAGLAVLLGGGAYALIGRGSDAGGGRQVVGATQNSTSTTRHLPSTTVTTVATTTTEVPVPTTEPAAPPKPSGSVMELQQRLADLGYDVGTIDGFAGTQTYYSIMAFQKVEGLSRTGEDSEELRAALATASKPEIGRAHV
jgi:peptidoglycan hydrolase-like protein with peptidoglycan-binding domain